MKRLIKLLEISLLLLILASCSPAANQKPFLIAQRNDGLHPAHVNKFVKRIDNVEQINQLERLINRLPDFPNEIVHCPLDNGVSYELRFFNTFDGSAVYVTANGCEQVKLNNKILRGIEPNGNGFRPYLMKVLELDEKKFESMP